MSYAQLVEAAAALGDLVERVVFLGGATVPLWLTEAGGRAPRATYDVDVVVEVASISAYATFQRALRDRDFHEDIESGVICRWQHKHRDLILDAVPVEQRLAGFTGRWLKDAAANGEEVEIAPGASIRAVPAPWLLVTKLEAFTSRGDHDCLGSRDFEDVVLLLDGRPELAAEVLRLPQDARAYVGQVLRDLSREPTFDYGLEGALGPDGFVRARDVVRPRWEELIFNTSSGGGA